MRSKGLAADCGERGGGAREKKRTKAGGLEGQITSLEEQLAELRLKQQENVELARRNRCRRAARPPPALASRQHRQRLQQRAACNECARAHRWGVTWTRTPGRAGGRREGLR